MRYDYEESKRIAAQDYSFHGMLMALMRKADSTNIELLKAAFPDVWAELDARYNAPGGLLPGESL